MLCHNQACHQTRKFNVDSEVRQLSGACVYISALS